MKEILIVDRENILDRLNGKNGKGKRSRKMCKYNKNY